jgi:Putative zinc-finger
VSKPAFLHPDYLVDGARRGALAPEERRRLGAHVAVCRACAWEQSATDDFARERATPGLDPARLDHLVERTLAQFGGGLGGLSGPPIELDRERPQTLAVARAPRTSAFAALRWGAAAAMVAVAIGAALALPVRGAHDDASLVAPTDANLDAGAAGPVLGGDS